MIALSGALADTLSASRTALPTLEELTTPADMPLVELWRRAAKAAALGEHDFATGISHARLDADQCRAVVADVAAVARALVVLDQRYELIPGWERLAGADRLGWAALACALDASLEPPNYAVEIQGWQPPVKTIRGPARPGLLGVLQAEHNLMVRLRTFPSVLNLRLVADSQRLLSADLASFAAVAAPELHATWLARERAYEAVQQLVGGLGGRVGRGDLAAAEGAHAVSRLRSVTQSPAAVDPRVLHGFDLLFARVDARVAEVVEEGLRRRAYLVRVPRPTLEVDEDADPGRALRYRPASDLQRESILDLIRSRLQITTAPAQPAPLQSRTADSIRSRAELHATLVHQSPRYQHRLGL
ncbi:hypothetical protein IEQ44_06310 [Nocardioides sp. Y6]|uniref:DUF294 domain-containing protein n=1 Tax=Nocardioides malaquae TaxID=2773426 RepID=A0ABR9RRR3_9ACTN|nr:hypothetical protein [Nocardioides malaquae]MBE7324259.1 hypothetical protein [Nocardioides malaquae]